MDLQGISNYSGYLNKINEASKVSDKLSTVENASDEELMDACKSFESYFMEKIFNAMLEANKAFTSDSEEDSYASQMVDYFKDTAVQTLTEESTKQGGIGLAKQLYEQMKIQYNGINPASLEDVTD